MNWLILWGALFLLSMLACVVLHTLQPEKRCLSWWPHEQRLNAVGVIVCKAVVRRCVLDAIKELLR